MAVYEEYKCYGPYKRSDGRLHVVLIKHDVNGTICERKTVSYPKYLVERYLDRYLTPIETVDHIDGNFSNNELSNLRVVPRSEHCRSHVSKKILKTRKCIICGKIFTTSSSNITCSSKSCRGACAHLNGYNKGNSIKREEKAYATCRSLIQEIVSVEEANSVKSLVDNTEQEH